MNADFKAYLEGADDVVILGIHLQAGLVDRWFTDQLFSITATIDGVQTILEERACMAQWPKRLGNGDFSSTVSIDDVDDEISSSLTNHGYDSVSVDIYLFLESHQKALGPLMQPVAVMPFDAAGLDCDGYIAQFTCKRPDIINKKFPVDIYEPDKFPGLEQV